MKSNIKRSLFMIIAGGMLVVSMLFTTMLGGTLAKYTSSVNGSDSASVAKWSFIVGTDEIAVASAPTLTFNLFDSIKEADTTTAETDVKAGLIAPGTGGKFEVQLFNKSEVNATYSISFTITNASGIPLEYSINGTVWNSDLTAIDASNVAIAMDDGVDGSGDDEKTITVYWRWAYSADAAGDLIDTALGIAAQTSAPSITIAADITATQVD